MNKTVRLKIVKNYSMLKKYYSHEQHISNSILQSFLQMTYFYTFMQKQIDCTSFDKARNDFMSNYETYEICTLQLTSTRPYGLSWKKLGFYNCLVFTPYGANFIYVPLHSRQKLLLHKECIFNSRICNYWNI